MPKFKIFLMSFIFIYTGCFAAAPAITTSINISDLQDFNNQPVKVQKLILDAAKLTQQNLTYLYGSAQPSQQGMDCSGTIYYLLNQNGVNTLPRSADSMLNWLEKQGKLHRVDMQNFNDEQLSALKPGDLLFWSTAGDNGPVNTNQRISHVMLYLGKNKTGQRLMFGSSDGRTYANQKMRGVSLFDFKVPEGKGAKRFVGYACVPNLNC